MLDLSKIDISNILAIMEREALGKNAPVFRFENESKETPFKILIATMLSARTKDTTTVKVVKRLFRIANTPKRISRLRISKLESLLYGVGFYKTKTRYLLKIAKILIDQFDSKVPESLDNLLNLPGVGRKTANIVLARAFGKDTLGVDVHVHRISNRLGLVNSKKTKATEETLIKKIPKKLIKKLNRIFVAYGQTVCLPKVPKCSECKINNICQRIGVKKFR